MGKIVVDWSFVLACASFLVAVLGLAWTYFGAVLNVKERLVALETKMELFWKPLQEYLVQAIHHPATPSIDAKLERFDSLNLNELFELKVELRKDFDDLVAAGETTSNKAFFYTLFLARIELRIHDKTKEMCKTNGVWSKLLGRI